MGWVVAAGAAAGGAVLWSVYFRFKDRLKPEPLKLMAAALGLGAAAAGMAIGVFRLLPAMPESGRWELFLFCTAVIGGVEEGLKFAAVRWVMVRWREFDEVIDGLVYAAMTGIGFATVENLIVAQDAAWLEQLARAAASPLTHALFAAAWGLPMAHALQVPRPAFSLFLRQAIPLAFSMFLHGLYDFLLLGSNATLPAALVILLLWAALIYLAPRAAAGVRTH